MGRTPLSSNQGLTKGAWTSTEDTILSEYIKLHGQGNWRNIPNQTGLKRSGKSCRLRWLNYLRPDIKRGNISPEEEDLIIRLHKLLGNRWSLIAGRLPGRTDNEIKNYWNTTLSKKLKDIKQQHLQHMPIRPENTIQSIQLNKPNKFQSPAQQIQKKRLCRCIKDDGAAAQDMEPNLIPISSINVGEDDDELACVRNGSFSPVLSEDPISLDNFNWDFDFDDFFLSDF